MSAVATLVNEGKRHHQAGNLHAAERLYREATETDPGSAEAWYFLGILHSQRRDFEPAIECLTRACDLDAKKPVFWYALGNALLESRRYPEAISKYRRAVRAHPEFVDAHVNLGVALASAGKPTEAIRAYREALRIKPDHAGALVNLGNAHRQVGHLDDARTSYEQAIAANPNIAEAHNNLGNILQQSGDLDGAITCFTAALDLQPEYVQALNNLGSVYKSRYEHEKAVDCFERALRVAPKSGLVRVNLGNTLLDQNRPDDAIEQYRQALEDDPEPIEARWRMRLALPMLYESESEIDAWRDRFTRGLDELIAETDVDDPTGAARAFDAIGAATNFYLNYQGRNDRDLQQRYGEFVHRLAATVHPKLVRERPMPRPGKDGRIRVAFVSAHFRYHAATRMTLSFIRDGDHDAFKYYCYHVSSTRDDYTVAFRNAADEWYENAADFEALCRRIVSDKPHVLIHTDVGMQGVITKLAALRLAPIQCAHWGHPITTGSPVIDRFLSSELMEPEGGDAHYTEALVRLPNLGVKYLRPEMPADPKSRESFGLPARGEGVVYLSCQSLFKYLPQHDHLFVEIAQRVPNAVFAFVAARSPVVTRQFEDRLRRAFRKARLEPDRHLRMFQRLDARTDFLALHIASDICLDTLDWSGGNTTIESLTAGLPVVTLPGAMMRSRHAYGMLRMLEIPETVASDKAEYVDLAVRLGVDEAFRSAISARVRERVDRIFADDAPIRALEDHIRRWVTES